MAKNGTSLYEVVYTPTGGEERKVVYVEARDVKAVNDYMVYRGMEGKRHSIKIICKVSKE